MSNTRDAISRLNIDPATTGRMYAAVKAEAVRLLQHCSVEQIIASHTRETAAAHESGHAVVTAAEGMSVRSVRVCVERRPWGGETHRVWGGETTERAPWWLRPEMGTGPYLQRSRIVIAGLCGEIIAGHDAPGSSVDEVVVSQFLAANAAKILGVDPEALWCRRVFAPVLATLEQHKDTHQRITRALLREKHIAGDQLAALLQPVTENTRGTTHV